MNASQIADFCIAVMKRVLTEGIYWFDDIMVATGMRSVWGGVMVFTAVFSVLLIPLRGGADLTSGALGGFVKSRVNRSKPTDHQD